MDIFITSRLITIITTTLLLYSWIFLVKERGVRIFFIFFIVMYLLYSGIGGALMYISNQYQYYYIAFTTCISIGLFFGLKSINNNRLPRRKFWSGFLKIFIKRYANTIIILYLLSQILPLVYPVFRLTDLIHPPQPDFVNMLFERFNNGQKDVVLSINSLASSLIFPFYLLSLYKYRKKTLTLSILVLAPYYFQYCIQAYIGRSVMLYAIIIILGTTYYSRPKLRKPIICISAVSIPTIIVFFVQYSIIRAGGVTENLDFEEAFSTLLEQESGYPLHFDDILLLQGNHIGSYFVWLFTMPFPGFVRGGLDVHFAAMFSEDILGRARTGTGFYILLPGIVGESVYLLGKQLFWINGLLYGFLMGVVYRFLTRYPQLLCILLYAAIDFGYVTNRAGFFGGFPFIGKILVYFFIILYLFKHYSNWKINYKTGLRKG